MYMLHYKIEMVCENIKMMGKTNIKPTMNEEPPNIHIKTYYF